MPDLEAKTCNHQSKSRLPLEPILHLTQPPSLVSPSVTNECLYKAAQRLRHMPPCFQTKGELNSAAFAVQQHWVNSAIKTQHRTTEKIHYFSPAPQRDTTECHIQSSPHTMSAPVTPLEEGIFGVGHITQACCNQTPSQLSMFKKSQLGGGPFSFSHSQHNTITTYLMFNYWQMLAAVISSLQLAKVIYVVTTYTCMISSL